MGAMKRNVLSTADNEAVVRQGESGRARTVTDLVYRRLRADIVWGVYMPGAPLRSDELRARYEVGVSPLREALMRLLMEKLVTSVGQRGFRVAEIAAANVNDVLETRLVLERAALAKSLRQGDLEWEKRVVAAFHALNRVSIPHSRTDQNVELWSSCHREFHMAILAACNSPWQMSLSALLFDQSERFRLLRATRVEPFRLTRDTAKEHSRIVDAVLARDETAAIAALEEHYIATTQEVLRALGE